MAARDKPAIRYRALDLATMPCGLLVETRRLPASSFFTCFFLRFNISLWRPLLLLYEVMILRGRYYLNRQLDLFASSNVPLASIAPGGDPTGYQLDNLARQIALAGARQRLLTIVPQHHGLVEFTVKAYGLVRDIVGDDHVQCLAL